MNPLPDPPEIILRHYHELLAALDPQWREHVTAALKHVIEAECFWDQRISEEGCRRRDLARAVAWGEGEARVELCPLVATGENLHKLGVSPRALKALGAPRAARQIPRKLRIENCAEITWGDRVLWGFGGSGVVIDLAEPNVIYHRHRHGDFAPPEWFTRHA